MILLIKPPYNPSRFRPGESLGLSILGAVLARSGHPVKVMDPTLQSIGFHGLMGAIKKERPRLVGLSLTCSAFMPAAVALIKAIKEWNEDIHITLGGPYPSFSYRTILEEIPEVDSVIRFEAESALPLLYGFLDRQDLWHTVPNLSFRDGKEILTTKAEPVAELDGLPWPLRSPWSFGPGVRDASVLSSRGCPWQCTYCIQSDFYRARGWRCRSAMDVVNEMKHLNRQWGAGAFLFNDDNFLGSNPKGRKRALEIAGLLKAEKLSVPWAISCLPVDVDTDLFEKLKDSGLSQVFLGVESGAQAPLDRWNKKATVSQNRKSIDILKGLGLGVELGFILFDPYTSLSEIKENLEFLRSTGLANTATLLNRMEVHEGMPVTERLEREGRLIRKDYGYLYRIGDERVEAVYSLFHQILPALMEAENACLQLRFNSQTSSRSSGRRMLGKLQARLSDRVCRAAGKIILFARSKGGADGLEREAFINGMRADLWDFNKEFRQAVAGGR